MGRTSSRRSKLKKRNAIDLMEENEGYIWSKWVHQDFQNHTAVTHEPKISRIPRDQEKLKKLLRIGQIPPNHAARKVLIEVLIDNLRNEQKDPEKCFEFENYQNEIEKEEIAEITKSDIFDEENVSDFILNKFGVEKRNLILAILVRNFPDLNYCPVLPSVV